MKKLTMTAIFMLSSFVLSQGVYDQYDIPEYQSQSFSVSGNPLFENYSKGDSTHTNLHVGANYNSFSQRPGYELSYGVEFDYNSNSGDNGAEGGDHSSANWDMNVPFGMSQYFGGTRGMFGFAEGQMDMFGGDNWDGVDDTSDLFLEVGAGYGRVVSAKPIAQAYAIADALGVDASDDTILAIAEVLGAADSYVALYKNDAMQKYYDDLANAAGAPDGAMTVYKVLSSGVYNVSDRWTGYEVKASLWNNYMRADGDDNAGMFKLRAEYAMPMNMDAQLKADFTYTMQMDSSDDIVSFDYTDNETLSGMFTDEESGGGAASPGGWSNMNLGATYSLDHSYTWQSGAGFEYDSWDFADGDVTFSWMTLSASTTYAVLNQMTVTGGFEYIMFDDGVDATDDDPEMRITSKVTYWVF